MSHDWTNDTLDALRLAQDPPADALVARLQARGELAGLGAWIADRAPPPPDVAAFLERHGTFRADAARLRHGQRVYGQHAVQAMLGLLCKGLPEAYAAPRGARILLVAGRFAREPRARLMETARFFAAVMEPGALEGPAIPEILKVRLVHALARRHIQADPMYQPVDGAPINQEDLLGTLMSFSILVLDALPRLGVTLRPDEESDYLHCWQAIGQVLGIAPAWIPHDPADARALFAAIRRRHHGPSEAGRTLTAALLDALASMLPDPLDDLPIALVWHLNAPAVPLHLGLPRPEGRSMVVTGLEALGRVVEAGDDLPFVAPLLERLGRGVYDAVYRYGTDGRRPTYTPPGG